MSEDLTKKIPETETDRLKLILVIVQRIDGHAKILNEIKDGLGRLTVSVGVLETRVEAVERRLDAVERRLDVLETRINIVVSRLDGIEARLDSFEKTINRSTHYLDRGQSVLNDAVLKIHVGFLDIDERLRSLETQQQKPTNSST